MRRRLLIFCSPPLLFLAILFDPHFAFCYPRSPLAHTHSTPDRQTNGQQNSRKNGQTNGQTNEQTKRQTNGWMTGNGITNLLTERRTNERTECNLLFVLLLYIYLKDSPRKVGATPPKDRSILREGDF